MNNRLLVLFSSCFSMCLDEERHSPWATFFWVNRRILLSKNYSRNLLKGVVLDLKQVGLLEMQNVEDHFCLSCIRLLTCFGMVGTYYTCSSLFEAEEISMSVVILLSYCHLFILRECNEIAGWTKLHSWLYNGSFHFSLAIFFPPAMVVIHLLLSPLHGTSLC